MSQILDYKPANPLRHYIELTLINSSESKTYDLWSKLYTQLHFAIVDITNQNSCVTIGIAFPEYRFNSEKGIGCLGTKLRIFSSSAKELENLDVKKWLERLLDFVHITSIQPIPENKIIQYVCFMRKQIKTNAERLARHRIKRGDITFDEAVKRYKNVITTTNLPFIQLKSLTNENSFKLFIEKRIVEKYENYGFNTYGLSATSTVPEF